jgi:hypothetical protein
MKVMQKLLQIGDVFHDVLEDVYEYVLDDVYEDVLDDILDDVYEDVLDDVYEDVLGTFTKVLYKGALRYIKYRTMRERLTAMLISPATIKDMSMIK